MYEHDLRDFRSSFAVYCQHVQAPTRLIQSVVNNAHLQNAAVPVVLQRGPTRHGDADINRFDAIEEPTRVRVVVCESLILAEWWCVCEVK